MFIVTLPINKEENMTERLERLERLHKEFIEEENPYHFAMKLAGKELIDNLRSEGIDQMDAEITLKNLMTKLIQDKKYLPLKVLVAQKKTH